MTTNIHLRLSLFASVFSCFRNFLVNCTEYEDTAALKLLSEADLEDILFEYSMVNIFIVILCCYEPNFDEAGGTYCFWVDVRSPVCQT